MKTSQTQNESQADQVIRVLIVEDHTGYREVVKIAINKTSDITVVGTFGAAEIAHRSLQNKSDNQSPDVILLNLNLSGITGLEAIPEFMSLAPGVKIIVLTQSDRQADICTAIQLGASGYLLKNATADELVDGIRNVMNGDAALDPGVAKFLLSKLNSVIPPDQGDERLTSRELEILELLAEGLTKKEIAGRLGISNSTVSHHVVHIFEKLKVPNAPAAIAQAFRRGLF